MSLDENIFKATDHYYDDIIIDLNIVSVEKVKEHLLRFGLATEPAESLCSAKVLGLQTYEKKGAVHWRRTELKEDIANKFELDDKASNIFSLREVGWSLSSCRMAAGCIKFCEKRLPGKRVGQFC